MSPLALRLTVHTSFFYQDNTHKSPSSPAMPGPWANLSFPVNPTRLYCPRVARRDDRDLPQELWWQRMYRRSRSPIQRQGLFLIPLLFRSSRYNLAVEKEFLLRLVRRHVISLERLNPLPWHQRSEGPNEPPFPAQPAHPCLKAQMPRCLGRKDSRHATK